MSFIHAFVTFNIALSNTALGFHGRVRVKAARHVDEPVTHFYAKVLSFCHSYTPGLILGSDYSDRDAPAFFREDPVDGVTFRGEVGTDDASELHTTLRHHPRAKFRVYFYDQAQLIRFCAGLRGSKSNWIAGMEFFLIDPTFLEKLVSHEPSNASWSVTIVDTTELYLSVDEQNLFTSLELVDVWDYYQVTIGNRSKEG
jgi:uncharacterized protein YaeQ